MKTILSILLLFSLIIISCDNDNNADITEQYTFDEEITDEIIEETKQIEKIYNCDDISNTFYSYEDANRQILNSDFRFHDYVNTDKSSWIHGAEYYSCDEEFGFLIIKTNTINYIHNDVPIHIWNNFKNAYSFGSFYNTYIKKRYRLRLN